MKLVFPIILSIIIHVKCVLSDCYTEGDEKAKWLTCREITEIPRNAENGTRYTSMSIAHSTIPELHNDSFADYPYLRTLTLYNCSISYIQPEVFTQLVDLLQLNAESNFLDKFDRLLTKSKYIGYLNLSNNKLNNVIIANNQSLHSLILNNNHISLFDGIVSQRLSSLRLSFNQISELRSYAFRSILNLVEVYLDHNRIRSIEKKSCQGLSKMKSLHLNSNFIESIPRGTFTGLVSLQELNLKDNIIKSIHETAFDNMNSLRILVLSRNYLEILHKRLFQRKYSLKIFLADNNKIYEISDNLFNDNMDLQQINISHNDITQLSANNFPGLFKLIELNLSNNTIKKILEQTFGDLTSLVYLNMSNNNIETLPNKFLENCTKIKSLDLSYNHIFNVEVILRDNAHILLHNNTYESQVISGYFSMNDSYFRYGLDANKLNSSNGILVYILYTIILIMAVIIICLTLYVIFMRQVCNDINAQLDYINLNL